MCFLLGVTPWLPVGDLPDARAAADLGHRLLDANRGTYEQVTTGDRRRGRWHWVFERRECLRCGTRVSTALQGEGPVARLTYWCPRCQRGPAPESRPPRELLGPRTPGRTRYRP